MKKVLLIIIAGFLCIGSNANASTSTSFNSLNASVTEVKELTREEYVESLAEEKGISYEEADILEQIGTENYFQNKYRKSKTVSEVVPRGQIVYRQINQEFEFGKGSFESTIMVTLHVKYDRSYYPSQGTCQKFVEVLDKGALATGTGTITFEKSAFSAVITNETTYGNEIYMMLSGNLQHVVQKSMGAAAEAAGFSISAQTTTTVYCRKFITKNYTFYSNWNLN